MAEGKLETAFGAYQQRPNVYDASFLISTFAKQAKDLSKSFAVYRTLLAAHVPPNDVVIRALAGAARQCKLPGQALPLLLGDIERFEIPLDEVTLQLLASLCLESRDAAAARTLLGTLKRVYAADKKVKVGVVECGKLCKVLMASGDLKSGLDLLVCMVDEWHVQPDAQLCTLLLSGCAEAGALTEGEGIHAYVLRSGIPIDTYLGTALITLYGKCGEVSRAFNVFNDQRCSSTVPDVGVWNAMLGAYARAGEGQGTQQAFALYNEMLGSGIRPDRMTYLSVVSACGDLGQCQELHSHILARGINIDSNLGAALISCYCRCGELGQAREIFDKLRRAAEGTKKSIDINLWTALIAGYAKRGDAESTLTLVKDMLRTGVQPDSRAVATALGSCAAPRDLKIGTELLSLFKESGATLDEAALIYMYHRCGDASRALSIFLEALRQMKESVVPRPIPGVYLWNVALDILTKQGQTAQAMALFAEMKQLEVSPNRATYLLVVGACGDCGTLQQGVEIHGTLAESGIPFDNYLGAALIVMYSKLGSIDKANSIWEDMRDAVNSRGTVPGREPLDQGAWNAIIWAQTKQGNSARALSLFKQMQEEGLPPTKPTFLAILTACGDLGDLAQGRSFHALLKETLGSQSEQDSFFAAALVRMYMMCGAVEQAMALFREGRAGSPPFDEGVWNAAIGGMARQGRSREALALFQEMQDAGITPNLVTFLSVLPACGAIGALQTGRELHRWIEQLGIPIDDLVGSALISMYGRAAKRSHYSRACGRGTELARGIR